MLVCVLACSPVRMLLGVCVRCLIDVIRRGQSTCVWGFHHAAEGVHQFRDVELLVSIDIENLEDFPDRSEELRGGI